MPRARPKRRIRLDNDERRAQLLQLARKSFSDRSYDEVSIDDLAREAKISKGLLYHYFPTKRDLYVAGLKEIADELVAKVQSVVPTNMAPADGVREGVGAFLDYISQHARAYVSLMRGGIGSDPEVAGIVESVRTRLADSFLEGSPLEPVLRGNVKFETVLRGWIGFVEATSIDWCAHHRMSRDALRDLLLSVFVGIMGSTVPQLLK